MFGLMVLNIDIYENKYTQTSIYTKKSLWLFHEWQDMVTSM